MPSIIIPSIRDNTTIARVAAMDSGGTMTKQETGTVSVVAPGRLILSRRGIESALGYPLRHSVWRGLKDAVDNGIITVADDMTLLIEREDRAPAHVSSPLACEEEPPQGGYTTQRYRSKKATGIEPDA